MVWGILMTTQDLNSDYLYLLLIMSDPQTITCQNFLDYYTLFSVINTFLSLIIYPISGYLTDKTDKYPFLILNISNMLQLLFFVCQEIPIIWTHNYRILLGFWLASQMVGIQNTNSIWKIIKKYTDQQTSSYEITSIGNIGDLTSDILESCLLLCLVLFLTLMNWSLKQVSIYFFSLIIILNCMLCTLSYILSYQIRFEPQYEIINEEFRKINVCQWLKESFKEFRTHKLTFFVFWHCILLVLYYTLVQYPLSFTEVSILSENTTNPCKAGITNIIILAAITSGLYLVGSITYRLFLVTMDPKIFYKWFYPIITCLLICITLSLKFVSRPLIIFFLTSTATVIPYYMYYYDYYTFSNTSNTSLYGWLLGLYGLFSTLAIITGQLITYLDLSILTLLLLLIILLVLTLSLSLYIRYRILNNEI